MLRAAMSGSLRAVLLGMSVTLLALAASCDRRVEPWVPADEEPAPPPGPVRVPGLEVPLPQSATGAPAAPLEGGPARGGESIRGTVDLAPGVEPPSAGVLFVIARSPAGGPPLAVRRLEPRGFPLPFEIGPGDVMIQGRPFAGPIVLSARLDSDGDAMTRAPEDLAAALDAPLQPGARDVRLLLSR